jgi:hypothetical protein
MSTKSWLRLHRKQAIIHTSIVVVFVLFLIFVSVPLFDRLEGVRDESKLQSFPLLAQRSDIRCYIDAISSDGRTALEIRGYAFIEGEDSYDSQVYIVLKSPNRTYIFDTVVQERRDVTRYLAELGLNLDYSGFISLIPLRKIANDEYTIGILIKKGEVEALRYTDRVVTKSGNTIEAE